MKKLFWILILISTCTACNSDDNFDSINPSNELSFQIEKSNSNTNFVSNNQVAKFKEKSSNWQTNSIDGMFVISKQILYDVTLENGKIIEFGFWFAKWNENKDLLILDGAGQSGENWNYISSETEAENFYRNCTEIRILVNNNVVFTQPNDDNLKIVNVQNILIDGLEKSYITINFNGIAYGWYDPLGEHQEVYEFNNGLFRGVIE